MNIMKTNMLLLDNKFMKDNADPSSSAPVPSNTQPEAGMKALAFEGLRNLMANPGLAKEVGVSTNQSMAKDSSAYVAPYSSNIAFGRNLTAGKKVVMALVTAAGLTVAGCEKHEGPGPTYITNTSTTEVNIDLSQLQSMFNSLYNILAEMLLQQKMSYEVFEQIKADLDEMRAQLSVDMNAIKTILNTMSQQIFDLNNDVNAGFNENNQYQQMIVSMLEKFMTRDEAISLINDLWAQIKAGNLSIEQAMEKIFNELHLTNQKLDTIIANQNRNYEELAQQTALLKSIKGDTKEAKEAAKLINQQLVIINNSIIDNSRKMAAGLAKLDGDMNAGFNKAAEAINCTGAQLAEIIKKTGLDIQRVDTWNAMMITGAINYNTHVTEKVNKELTALRADFNAGRLTAEQYAQKMLAVAEGIDIKVGTLAEDFNTYANDMRAASKIAITELKKGNKSLAEIKALTKDVISNQQKAYAMFVLINGNIKKVDIDMNANAQALAKQLGCTYADLKATLMWLGYTEAQIANMNTSAIIKAIQSSSNKEICVLGGKLDAILDKMDKGTISDKEAINQIVALLENIDKNVAEINSTLKELSQNFSSFYSDYKNNEATQNKYLCQILKQNQFQSSVLANLKTTAGYMYAKINELTNVANNIYAATQDNTKFNALMAELKQIKSNGGVDYNKLQEMFNAMGTTIEKAMNMNASQLASVIKNFQNTYIATEQKELDIQTAIYNKLDYLGCLIKGKTTDNTGVINAINNLTKAVNNGNTNITKELEAVNTQLTELNKKADKIIDNIAALIVNVKTYGDKIINTYVAGNNDVLAAIKANGKKIDVTNKTLAELKTILNNIKPDIKTLADNSKVANTNLDIIAKKVVDIDNSVKNLNNIAGGKGLTAAELEALWKQHDAANWAKAEALVKELHAENILKLNEAIEYLKKGNQIALDTYNLVYNYANKANLNADQIKKLLTAIYDYLPKLICNCKCQADVDANEGIINDIQNLLGIK